MSNTKEIPTYCRYCHKVQITFDQSRKSKNGKLIPIEKSSGLSHECDQRPKTNSTVSNTTPPQEPIQVEQEVLQLLQLLTSKVKVLIDSRQNQ